MRALVPELAVRLADLCGPTDRRNAPHAAAGPTPWCAGAAWTGSRPAPCQRARTGAAPFGASIRVTWPPALAVTRTAQTPASSRQLIEAPALPPLRAILSGRSAAKVVQSGGACCWRPAQESARVRTSGSFDGVVALPVSPRLEARREVRSSGSGRTCSRTCYPRLGAVRPPPCPPAVRRWHARCSAGA